MKKRILIICGIVLAAGLVCGAMNLENGTGSENRGMLNENGREVYRQIREIKGKLYAGRIYFKTADTDEITVESTGIHEKLGFQSYEKDGVLYLQMNKKIMIGSKMSEGMLTVTMPRYQMYERIDLSLKTGEVDADGLNADFLKVENSAGHVSLHDFSAKKAQFECGAGTLSGQGNVAGNIEIDCGVGEVDLTLKGNKNEYNYDLDCGIGEIQCGGDRYSGIGREIHLDNQASKTITVHCGIGQIDIDYAL